MKRLSEFKDEEALDVLVEILDFVIDIMKDNRFKIAIMGDKEKNIPPNRIEAIKICLTEHRKSTIAIMAVLNETPVEQFHYDALTLPKMVLQMFNDKELIDFFKSQSQTDSEISSGSATENTEETEKE